MTFEAAMDPEKADLQKNKQKQAGGCYRLSALSACSGQNVQASGPRFATSGLWLLGCGKN